MATDGGGCSIWRHRLPIDQGVREISLAFQHNSSVQSFTSLGERREGVGLTPHVKVITSDSAIPAQNAPDSQPGF